MEKFHAYVEAMFVRQKNGSIKITSNDLIYYSASPSEAADEIESEIDWNCMGEIEPGDLRVECVVAMRSDGTGPLITVNHPGQG